MSDLCATRFWFDNDETLVVALSDDTELQVSLTDFPALHAATWEQRTRGSVCISGLALRWEELDEDISVSALLSAYPRKKSIRAYVTNRMTPMSLEDVFRFFQPDDHPRQED